MSLALLWYAVDARKWFKGPRINAVHRIHGIEPEGKEEGQGSGEQSPVREQVLVEKE